MLKIPVTKKENSQRINQEPRWTTYLPSPLILQLVIENGWKVVKIELAPSEDQLGLVYLVTLRSAACQQDQQLVLPRNALVQKILEEQPGIGIPVAVNQPGEVWLPVI